MNMKKLKYRVWDVEKNEFLKSYADLGLMFFTNYSRNDTYKIVGVDWFISANNNENPLRYIVTEYVGMDDMEGNPIYDGDIVELHVAKQTTGFGKYLVKSFRAKYILKPILHNFVLNFYTNDLSEYNITKVIGNKFKNIEMLKGDI